MKQLISGLWLTCICLVGKGQADSKPLYLQFPDIPPFTLTKVPDSSSFGKAALVKKKPVLIIYFSPDCDHCQQTTRQLIAQIDAFKDIQVIMASPLSYALIADFYTKYAIASYPNIVMGHDEKFFLGSFYRISEYPTMFLYNKKGRFIKKLEGSIELQQVADAFK
jgi:thioredoxin-related protein